MTDNKNKNQPSYPISSVDRALRLIILVARQPTGIRIADAAEALNAAPSTAHRLLQMLVHHGFAHQDPETKLYFAGPVLQRLGDPLERIREIARPTLVSIVDTITETVHLSILEGDQALTLLSVESPHLLRVGDRTGHTRLAAHSGMGRVLLSELPDGKLMDILTRSRVESEPLLQQLREIRSRGYILQEGEIEPGVSAAAVPVRGPTRQVEFALGATFPTGRVTGDDLENLIEELKLGAARLEISLNR